MLYFNRHSLTADQTKCSSKEHIFTPLSQFMTENSKYLHFKNFWIFWHLKNCTQQPNQWHFQKFKTGLTEHPRLHLWTDSWLSECWVPCNLLQMCQKKGTCQSDGPQHPHKCITSPQKLTHHIVYIPVLLRLNQKGGNCQSFKKNFEVLQQPLQMS